MSLDAAPDDATLRRIADERQAKRNGVITLGPQSPLRLAVPSTRPGPKPARSLERMEQVALFEWLDEHAIGLPELALAFAVPNGGKRSIGAAGKLKMEGVKPGVPDIVLPVPRGGYGALYVEMKTAGGSITPSQADWHHQLTRVGNKVVIASTWEQARDAILSYLAP